MSEQSATTASAETVAPAVADPAGTSTAPDGPAPTDEAAATVETSVPSAEEAGTGAPSAPSRDALYIGLSRGPVLRVASDGTTTLLGESGVTQDLALGADANVYAVVSSKVYALVGDEARALGSDSPLRFTGVAARALDDVWAITRNQVAHFDGSAWSTVADELFASQTLQDLAFDASGQLWVVSNDMAYRHAAGAFVEVPPMEGSSFLHALLPNPEGGLDVQHMRGIDRFDGDAWSMVPIRWVERSRDGRIAFSSLRHASVGGGMLALTNSLEELCLKWPAVQYFGSSSPARMQLTATKLTHVAVDARGRPWYGTNGGLLLLERYGAPRVEQWWPIHALPGLTSFPVRLLAVGGGPATMPAPTEPPPSTVRGNLGRRYAGAQVQVCSDAYRRGRDVECAMNALSWPGVADARGRFEIASVFPGGYELLVRSGNRWLTTTGRCCAARLPGEDLDLGELSVVR